MTDMTEVVAAWARAEAEKQYPAFACDDEELTYPRRALRVLRRGSFQMGVELLADRLLSDEAIERSAEVAAIEGFERVREWEALPDWEKDRRARVALVAALAAVTTTKGDE